MCRTDEHGSASLDALVGGQDVAQQGLHLAALRAEHRVAVVAAGHRQRRGDRKHLHTHRYTDTQSRFHRRTHTQSQTHGLTHRAHL